MLTLFCITEKGYEVLQTLLSEFPGVLSAVVSARDPNQQDYYAEIRAVCEAQGLPFFDRRDSPRPTSRYALCVAWRWMIDPAGSQVVVLHDSLLPRYRGFNPLVSMLINGERKIGVTALFAADKYDCGDIIAQSAAPITYPIKIGQAIQLIAENYRQLARQIAHSITRGETLRGTPQDEAQVSYSLWRDAEDYAIDWAQPAERVRRFIDAVGHPYQGALTRVGDAQARLLDAEEIENVKIENRAPGKVIFMQGDCPVVVCGEGLLKVNELIDDETGQSLLPLAKFRTRFR